MVSPVTPFQGSVDRCALPPRGIAPGCHVAAPSRRSLATHHTKPPVRGGERKGVRHSACNSDASPPEIKTSFRVSVKPSGEAGGLAVDSRNCGMVPMWPY